jgi:thiol-disulfide isomerase/thioredoxin
MMRALTVLMVPAILAGRAIGEDVSYRKVKYDELARFVAGQKGKVVVVDFWATFCIPCRNAFPHVVELHQKQAARGLVVVTVSVDDPSDANVVEEVGKFLRRQGATTTNFLLDEAPEVWTARLKAKGVPLVFVFNRAGQIETKYTEAPKPAKLDALLEKLLSEKGAP